ncbi:hypothetical protein Tco_1175496 [Tanacetum coccineum]
MVGKGFSGRNTPLFPTMMVQDQQEQGEGSEVPTYPHHTLTIIQPSTSQPRKKQRSRMLKRKDTKTRSENVSKISNDPFLVRVIDLEKIKTAQAQEITSLKLRVKRLEKKRGSRTYKLKRLYKIGRSVRVISSDKASLGDQEDASKQGRKIDDIDKDTEITLVYETQERYGDEEMFDTYILDGDEVLAESEVTVKDVNLSVDEVTLAQALASLKSVKVQEKANVVEELSESITTTPALTTTTAATTITTVSTRPRDKGKGKMEEPKKPMKKKELIRLEEEIISKLQAEFDEEVRLAREKAEKEEEANIKLFDKAMKRVNTFVDMDTELVEGSEVRAEGKDKETTELQRLIEVVLDKEEVAIDAIPLATKPPSIVDWKFYKEGKKSYYQIIRADGSSKMYLVFSHMLKSFDKEDLETLYKLLKAKYGSTRPVEDLDLVLYGNLKTMFDPYVEDQVWKNQSDYRVLEWKLYDSCGVHSLRKQNVHIYMLVEKRYSLTTPIITDMLNKKLKADHWNEMCYQLLKLITK